MKVKIAAAQYPVSRFKNWQEYETHTERWVKEAVEKGAEILLFPEYGSMEITSLFPNAIQQDLHLQIAEMQQYREPFLHLFARLAKAYSCLIVAPSYPVKEKDRYLNRVYVLDENGLLGYQDKLFMTRFEKEEWGIRPAAEPVLHIFDTRVGKFAIQICYDIEFPIGSALAGQHEVDFIFAPSCTEAVRGAERVHIGARARAMENQCYTVVAQTILNAEWSPAVDINYGFGAFYATPDKGFPERGIVHSGKPQVVSWEIAELDTALLHSVRREGQVFNHRDTRRLRFTLDQNPIEVRICKGYA